MTLAEYLKTLDLSCEDFAKRMNVSRQTVDYWARGERAPHFRNMIKIAHATSGLVDLNSWEITNEKT